MSVTASLPTRPQYSGNRYELSFNNHPTQEFTLPSAHLGQIRNYRPDIASLESWQWNSLYRRLLQTILKVFYIPDGEALNYDLFQEFEFRFKWYFCIFGSWDCISFLLMSHQTLNKIMRLMNDNLK